jgi:hypothetical protein
MRKIKIIILIALTALLCAKIYPQKGDTTKMLKIENGKDSTEYDLVVFDPDYSTFLMTQPPKNFYSENYYKSWNGRYVTEWNIRYRQSRSNLYESYIDYDPNTEYGLDLEYKLYYFFRFFEKKNNVVLVPRGK